MKSQVLLTVWCSISGGAGGEIWHWSLSGVKGLKYHPRVRHVMLAGIRALQWGFPYPGCDIDGCISLQRWLLGCAVFGRSCISRELVAAIFIRLGARSSREKLQAFLQSTPHNDETESPPKRSHCSGKSSTKSPRLVSFELMQFVGSKISHRDEEFR